MKALKPSHREKRRYMLVEGEAINKSVIKKILMKGLGIIEYSKASPFVVYDKNAKVIISVKREYVDKIRTVFLISERELKIPRVSGNIKKIKDFVERED